jgi:hypothetical protein
MKLKKKNPPAPIADFFVRRNLEVTYKKKTITLHFRHHDGVPKEATTMADTGWAWHFHPCQSTGTCIMYRCMRMCIGVAICSNEHSYESLEGTAFDERRRDERGSNTILYHRTARH